jgi:hypothetical protein
VTKAMKAANLNNHDAEFDDQSQLDI